MEQWDPTKKNLGGKGLFGATVRRFHKNGARVAGVIWYQGCSESNPLCAKVYTLRMKRLVGAMRKEFGDPRLPFVLVQIGRYVTPTFDSIWTWNSVQEQQRRHSRERLGHLIEGIAAGGAGQPESVQDGLRDGARVGEVNERHEPHRLAEAVQ